MPHIKIIYSWVMSADRDNNIRFNDLVKLLISLGFECRIRGDHHIFTKENIDEIINLQPRGDKAKAYQVKQVRYLIRDYQLEVKNDEV